MIQRSKAYYKPEWMKALKEYIEDYDYCKDRCVVTTLESSISNLIGRKYCLAVNSASNAIFMSLYLWSKRYPTRNEVIIPNWGYPAAVKACITLGLRAIPIEIDKDTLGMSGDSVFKHVGSSTLAVIHIENNGVVGNPGDIIDALPADILFIQDSSPSMAQKNAGKVGDVSIFSFSPTKPLMAGEGGVILTDNDELYDQLESMRHTTNYDDILESLNFNLSPFLAAYLLPQLNSLEEIGQMRESVHDKYKKHLDIFEEKSNSHGTIMYLSKSAAAICKKFELYGIEHRYRYYPLYHMNPDRFPVSHEVFNELIDLPMHHELTDNQIKSICTIVRKAENE